MPRTAAILSIVALALVAGFVGLRPLLSGGGLRRPRTAQARPAGQRWIDTAVPPPGSTPSAAGTTGPRVTVRNDMPATLTIATRPDGQTYRVGWGGGDVPLGTGPVAELVIVYHDAYWPYVYAITCPANASAVRLRMSDVWHGRVPEGFVVRRGRPERDGVAWFDDGRGEGAAGPRGRG